MWVESFGWILLNSKFICVVGTLSTYLGKWGERVNFGNTVAEIQQKYERERETVGERKCMNFGNVITEIPVAWSACPSVCACSNCEVRKPEIQLWQCHCRNRGRKKKFVAIVAITLPKMGGGKKWLPKSGEEFKKKNVTFIIFSQ